MTVSWHRSAGMRCSQCPHPGPPPAGLSREATLDHAPQASRAQACCKATARRRQQPRTLLMPCSNSFKVMRNAHPSALHVLPVWRGAPSSCQRRKRKALVPKGQLSRSINKEPALPADGATA